MEAIFPLMTAAQETPAHMLQFLGTGFFINTRGLALTAAHVVSNLSSGDLLRAALPSPPNLMVARRVLWAAPLPDSDIAVVQIDTPRSFCFNPRFEPVSPGQDVHTYAIPESLLEKDAQGDLGINSRVAKGYISHGNQKWIAASFALPKGMSGAPVVMNENNLQRATGVFVGQNRGEEIEDQITDVTDHGPRGKHTLVERTARIEYFARGELLLPFADYIAPEFGDQTLKQLTES